MDKADLINMELHEERNVASGVFVRRVVGGWIYEYYETVNGCVSAAVFVPIPTERHSARY